MKRPIPNTVRQNSNPPPANSPSNARTRENHSPSRKSPQITVQTPPPQIPLQTPVRAKITAHQKNPPKSPSRHPPRKSPFKRPYARKSQPIKKIPPNHSSDNPPPRKFPFKRPYARKSQPIKKIPPNHSSDTPPANPPSNARTRENHSPSKKSPQITVQTTPPSVTGLSFSNDRRIIVSPRAIFSQRLP